MSPRGRRLLGMLASLWLTLACVLAAALVALGGEAGAWPVATPIAVPFALLCVNLMAALASSPKLRRQGGLLGFHLALAALALLVAADRLLSFSGHVEVTEGTAFAPRLVEAKAGLLHVWRLGQVRFVQGPFSIDYAPGMKRRETRSTVMIPADDGTWRSEAVGDDDPLLVGGYRFYTSFNKGYAPLLSFVDRDGEVHRGAVHLPSYPLNHFDQGNEWQPPGGSRPVKLWLSIPEPVYAEDREWQFRKPEDARLVVFDGDARHELRPGDELALGDGVLRYLELRSWMGYTISANPLTPWMLAAVVIAVISLGWHVVGKMLRVPWQAVGSREGAGHAG